MQEGFRIAWFDLKYDRKGSIYRPFWVTLSTVMAAPMPMGILEDTLAVLLDSNCFLGAALTEAEAGMLATVLSVDWNEDPCKRLSHRQWRALEALVRSKPAVPNPTVEARG
jgi:hypothetical protein